MKNGRPPLPNRGLAYRPDHRLDLDSGLILAASAHEANRGDIKTLPAVLDEAAKDLEAVDRALTTAAVLSMPTAGACCQAAPSKLSSFGPRSLSAPSR